VWEVERLKRKSIHNTLETVTIARRGLGGLREHAPLVLTGEMYERGVLGVLISMGGGKRGGRVTLLYYWDWYP